MCRAQTETILFNIDTESTSVDVDDKIGGGGGGGDNDDDDKENGDRY